MPKARRGFTTAKRSGSFQRTLTTTVVEQQPKHSFFKPLPIKPPPKLTRGPTPTPQVEDEPKAEPKVNKRRARHTPTRKSDVLEEVNPVLGSVDSVPVSTESPFDYASSGADQVLVPPTPTPVKLGLRRSARLQSSQESQATSEVATNLSFHGTAHDENPPAKRSAKNQVVNLEEQDSVNETKVTQNEQLVDLERDESSDIFQDREQFYNSPSLSVRSNAKDTDSTTTAVKCYNLDDEPEIPDMSTPPGDPALAMPGAMSTRSSSSEPEVIDLDDEDEPVQDCELPETPERPIEPVGELSFQPFVASSAVAPKPTHGTLAITSPFEGVGVGSLKQAAEFLCSKCKCTVEPRCFTGSHHSPVTPEAMEHPAFRTRSRSKTKEKKESAFTLSEEEQQPKPRSRLSRSRSKNQNSKLKKSTKSAASFFTPVSSKETTEPSESKEVNIIQSSEEEEEKPAVRSKLSRRRKAADRGPEDKTTHVKTKNSNDVVDLCLDSPDEPKKKPFNWIRGGTAPKRRKMAQEASTSESTLVNEVENDGNGEQHKTEAISKPKQPLHSFFTKPRAPCKNQSDSRKLLLAAPDAWTSQYATVHANAPRYSNCSVEALPRLEALCPTGEADWKGIRNLTEALELESEDEENASDDRDLTEKGQVSVWADLYEEDELGKSNNSRSAELQDWLRKWYRLGDGNVSGYESDGSCSEDYRDFVELDDVERIALLTGPTGCGKSIVVKNVARRLGLDIVEINQSMCRASRKVKDRVMDALKIHRVTSKLTEQLANSDMRNVRNIPRTLVVFEEVDMLHDDEVGFWKMIRDIALEGDCKRPIVCTANKMTATMQAVFGHHLHTDFRADVFGVLTPEQSEEVQNAIRLKHICFKRNTQREVSDAVGYVSAREGLQLKEETLRRFVYSEGRTDIRSAINTLQFRSIPSRHGFNSDYTWRAIRCANHLSPDVSSVSALSIAEEQRTEGESRIMHGLYYALTKAESIQRTEVEDDNSTLCAIANTLDGFSLADVLEQTDRWDFDHDIASSEEVMPPPCEMRTMGVCYAIATDLRAHALTTLAPSGLTQVEAQQLAHDSEMPLNTSGEVLLRGFQPILGRRAAATEYVPALRMMAVGERAARERSGDTKYKLKSKSGMKLTFSKISISTRSRTRGSHMHLLGIREPVYLESNCMAPRHAQAGFEPEGELEPPAERVE